ncbi:uncharacterized protein EV420DRAFT_1273696, partial [Desarmillaria tabescens]
SRTPGTPRRLSHAAAGHTVKKGRNTACDVWSFFIKSENCHHCAFCTCVFKDNELPGASDFGSKTSTDILQHHLLDYHTTSWLTKCDNQGIQVRSTQKRYQDAIHKFHLDQGKQSSIFNSTGHRAFSHEAFIDSLVAWVVADDQACTIHI